MVEKVKIKDLERSYFRYIKNINFPKSFLFKKGKNIIVGENGCGKTTLIKIIALHTFCLKSEFSKINHDEIRKWVDAFNYDLFYDGIDVFANYDICTYKSFHEEDKEGEDSVSNITNFVNFISSKQMSSGENTLRTIQSLFECMFSGKYNHFDKSFLTNKVNDFWKPIYEKINSYLINHNVKENNPIYTILLDEPDRNLSISNILKLYQILSTEKENEQMIVSIHNPILIYKLSKLKHINFIELTNEYVKKVIKIIEN